MVKKLTTKALNLYQTDIRHHFALCDINNDYVADYIFVRKDIALDWFMQ